MLSHQLREPVLKCTLRDDADVFYNRKQLHNIKQMISSDLRLLKLFFFLLLAGILVKNGQKKDKKLTNQDHLLRNRWSFAVLARTTTNIC